MTSATKSNGIVHTHAVLGRDRRRTRRRAPRTCAWDQEHIDALCAKLVLDPGRFDVIVASNLFGDILSPTSAAAVAGSIGIAPAANINPEREFPSMFEPVHGSAPDIAGRGIANPIGAIWTAAMMLEHLGHAEAAAEVRARSPTYWPRPDPDSRPGRDGDHHELHRCSTGAAGMKRPGVLDPRTGCLE